MISPLSALMSSRQSEYSPSSFIEASYAADDGMLKNAEKTIIRQRIILKNLFIFNTVRFIYRINAVSI
jgi:hypothetical protein